MRLFYAPGTCALACWIALKWAGAEFEPVRVDYASEEFKRINPLAMVPALDIGLPRAMTQADAIFAYIVERYPEAHLGADDDIVARFEFAETMSFLTGDFHPAFWPFFSPQRYTTDESEAALEAVRQAAYGRIDRVMSHLDGLIGESGHVYRNRRTVADAYAFIMARWTVRTPKSWKAYPNVARLFAIMQKDEAVQEVLTQSAA